MRVAFALREFAVVHADIESTEFKNSVAPSTFCIDAVELDQTVATAGQPRNAGSTPLTLSPTASDEPSSQRVTRQSPRLLRCWTIRYLEAGRGSRGPETLAHGQETIS